MLLREADFIEKEGNAPLLMQNHKWLHTNSDKAWKLTRSWPKLLLGQNIEESTLDDEKKTYSGHEQKESDNYGLKIIPNPDRIHRKDVDRTFNTEPKRQLLITLLDSLNTAFNDYQQTMSYVSGIMLLFYDPKTVFQMMYVLGKHPHYNMSGTLVVSIHWHSLSVHSLSISIARHRPLSGHNILALIG